MSYRKILYGYQIQNGELTLVPEEAAVVNRIAGLYLDGLSYQKLADLLNQKNIPRRAARRRGRRGPVGRVRSRSSGSR